MDPKSSCPPRLASWGHHACKLLPGVALLSGASCPCPGSYRSALQVGERGLFLPQTSQIGLNTGSQASRNESKGLDWIPEMQNLSESI